MLDVADASTIAIAGGDRQQQTLGTRPVCPSASSDHPDKRAVVRPGRGVGIHDCEHSLDHVGVRFGLGYPGGDTPGEVLIRALRKPREQREEPFGRLLRSEEHTSELKSLMRNTYAVFSLKKNNHL